jgi:hypothetical protein
VEVLGLELDICGGHAVPDDEANKPIFGRDRVAYEVALQPWRRLFYGGIGRRLLIDLNG